MNISYNDETYEGLPFYSLIETGSFDLECTYNERYEPQHFFINRVLVTQHDLVDGFFWDYDIERVRNEIRDFELSKSGFDEPLTYRNTGCVRKVA